MINFVVVKTKNRPVWGWGAVVTPAGWLAGALLAERGRPNPDFSLPLGQAGMWAQSVARWRALPREGGRPAAVAPGAREARP